MITYVTYIKLPVALAFHQSLAQVQQVFHVLLYKTPIERSPILQGFEEVLAEI